MRALGTLTGGLMDNWTILVLPKILGFRHRLREKSLRSRLKWLGLTALAGGFWTASFFIFAKVLTYFRSVELFGDLLNSRLLAMMLLTFFSILLFSNLISSLSTFFLSEDLNLILSRPVSLDRIYYARLAETMVYSSWMVLLFAMPVFAAYGWVYRVFPWVLPGSAGCHGPFPHHTFGPGHSSFHDPGERVSRPSQQRRPLLLIHLLGHRPLFPDPVSTARASG